MINNEKVLAIIPARGGSKGVLGKNIRSLGGQPLIAWTIAAAKQSRYIDRLVLSSDDPKIISVAQSFGCDVPFVRPAHLAADNSPGIAPVLHALELLPGYAWVVLLQPTSPLRTAADIDDCIVRCHQSRAPACVSVTTAEEHPNWMYKIDSDQILQPLMSHENLVARRQDLTPIYILNGAVYVAQCNWVQKHKTFLSKETVACIMPRERSWDIDSELDLKIVDSFLREKNG